MLEGPPDAAAPREAGLAFGLVLEIEPEPPCEVWAEHWPALRVFGAMQSQWLYRPDGHREGLNYTALPLVEQRLRIRPRDRRPLFAHLQALETEALRIFRERE